MKRVAVTGLGAVTPIGNDVQSICLPLDRDNPREGLKTMNKAEVAGSKTEEISSRVRNLMEKEME